eukprot:m.344591 g.344591  ORF g.344591 m.344591 type:complete len:416 (+) comp24732_c0_seq1:83-1330(+)
MEETRMRWMDKREKIRAVQNDFEHLIHKDPKFSEFLSMIKRTLDTAVEKKLKEQRNILTQTQLTQNLISRPTTEKRLSNARSELEKKLSAVSSQQRRLQARLHWRKLRDHVADRSRLLEERKEEMSGKLYSTRRRQLISEYGVAISTNVDLLRAKLQIEEKKLIEKSKELTKFVPKEKMTQAESTLRELEQNVARQSRKLADLVLCDEQQPEEQESGLDSRAAKIIEAARRFESAFKLKRYKEAAFIAAHSPERKLRKRETFDKFKSAMKIPTSSSFSVPHFDPPAIIYADVLLATEPNDFETLMCIQEAVRWKLVRKITFWFHQRDLKFSLQLARLLEYQCTCIGPFPCSCGLLDLAKLCYERLQDDRYNSQILDIMLRQGCPRKLALSYAAKRGIDISTAAASLARYKQNSEP